MKKDRLTNLILCGGLAVLLCFSSTGCLAMAAREAFKEKIDSAPAASETPSPTEGTESTENGEGWSLGELADNIANRIGTSIGNDMRDFSEDLGTAMGNDMNKVGNNGVAPDPNQKSQSDMDYLNELNHDEFGQIVDAVKEKKEEVFEDGDGKPAATVTDAPDSDIKSDDKNVDDESKPVLDGPYHISYVVDGDTVKFEEWGSDVRVRLIGIDTPESVASDEYLEKSGKQNTQEGKDASSFLKAYFPKNKVEQNVVYIERDVEYKDRYDRELVYLYAERDGKLVFVNELLLREGLAKLFSLQPNTKYADNIFLDAQRYARENGKGFWGTGYFEE